MSFEDKLERVMNILRDQIDVTHTIFSYTYDVVELFPEYSVNDVVENVLSCVDAERIW